MELYIGTLVIACIPVALFLISRRLLKSVKSVKDKVVLITGASSGLGEECAKVFYENGAVIVLCARRKAELERVRQSLLDNPKITADPKRIILQELDLEKSGYLNTIVQRIISKTSTIDILINNAGVSYRGVAHETELSVFSKLLKVNVLGTVELTTSVLQHMIEKESGHIVNVSSVQGKIAIPYRSAYAASKHALHAYSDSLRAEVSSKGIQVSVIAPAYIRTNLSVNSVTSSGEKHAVMDATTAKGMHPRYVAQVILSMVKDEKREVILAPFHHRLAIILRAVYPSMYFRIMNMRATKEENSYA
ncbi:DgyrCDS12629 [Dimorphilus gyrociliatus]|uniref:DgyrCDS12629 n=1 Tax=Dimorphilus gyrociliatus TaxID=2664684 RepID=A0A7I8W719_9ANNE|nr:DgyrCDS12629 [Dimorphilus gyrociliatus]